MSRAKSLKHPEDWTKVEGEWRCTVCLDYSSKVISRALRHEGSQSHEQARKRRDLRSIFRAGEERRYRLLPSSSPAFGDPYGGGSAPMEEQTNGMEYLFENIEGPSYEDLPAITGRDLIAEVVEGHATLRQGFPIDDDGSDEGDWEGGERSDEEEDEEDEEFAQFAVQGTKRARRTEETYSKEWYPWVDKLSCTLDIMMHLPRSVFSERQLGLFLWSLEINGVKDVPSVKSTKALNSSIQSLCGVDSIKYKGSLGHTYYVNSLEQIVAQEFANPKVKSRLHVYPRETEGPVQEAREAHRWLHEVDDSYLTPMARIQNKDFYIFEPAMLNDKRICMPHRFFTRPSPHENQPDELFFRAWQMCPIVSDTETFWRVLTHAELVINASQLLYPFPSLVTTFQNFGIPDPRKVREVQLEPNGAIQAWDKTDPLIGNKWRERAKGARVVSFPLWLYCDDTSGNSSKRWNKHNSFLFTAGGLPREETQKEYNIHFLSTSNIAPPLEMLEGIVEQMRTCQENGIWAYDCQFEDFVLVLLWTLALLGDNPMQSEMAAHMGMQANLFCRICKVTGSVAREGDDEEPTGSVQSDHDSPSDASGEGSIGRVNPAKSTSRGRTTETPTHMLSRIKDFMKVGEARTKEDTLAKLNELYSAASQVGGKTRVQHLKTDSGVKDTFLEFFLDKLADSYSGIKGKAPRQTALNECVNALPDPPYIFSPIWRLNEIDPHSSTPVEILHVVLLGFVKYFWRDVVKNQLKNDEERATLEHRLSSFDVSGLGISKISGHTLVKYASSLTGGDFRVISQVAPFVIYGMVPPECLRAWTSLSKLIPLVWQPKIADMRSHIRLLQQEISSFLYFTALWTPRWFNKPKFHVLLHLPDHIQRFGPPILFATEAFESFNAIIRAKSIHSNRHAPSRDIARQFAQGNRVRHLLSGGRMQLRSKLENPDAEVTDLMDNVAHTIDGCDAGRWRAVGRGPLGIVRNHAIIRNYLGIHDDAELARGKCNPERVAAKRLDGTLLPQCIPIPPDIRADSRFITNKSVTLSNGDVGKVGESVLFKNSHAAAHPLCVGKICEIIQRTGSENHLLAQVDYIVVRVCNLQGPSQPLDMPTVIPSHHYMALRIRDVLCTVNVPHNCNANSCPLSGTRRIYEEREDSGRTAPVVLHLNERDCLLNTAQMRDAEYLQQLRVPPRARDSNEEERELMTAVEREIVSRANKAKETKQAAKRKPTRVQRAPEAMPMPLRVQDLSSQMQ